MSDSGASFPSTPPPSRARSAPPWVDRFRLSGPTVIVDARVHAVRRDIADIALADRIFAPHYARPDRCMIAAPSAMLREAPTGAAHAVSQLLRGEAFAVVDLSGGWAWGYGLHDRYVGYLDAAALGPSVAADHLVHASAALVFAEPDIKAPVIERWPIGARFAAGAARGDFVAADEGWVHRRHARAIAEAEAEADPVMVAARLLGAPYLWGGRGGGGVDCSGLVQLALGLCGIAAPRDSDQQRALGREVAADELARGDLVFFPGHVGLMADGATLLHANAHAMAVTREPLADVVARFDRPDPILARRRLA